MHCLYVILKILMMNELNIFLNKLLIYASMLIIFTWTALFYLKNVKEFEKIYTELSDNDYKKIVWPAIFANNFFCYFFGNVGNGIKGLLTWRSIGVTFLFSTIANALCLFIILENIPNDIPFFDLNLIKITVFSYFTFILFNLVGDMFSICVTRTVLWRIVKQRTNFLKFIGYDILGIMIGYLITIFPSLLYCLHYWITGDELNKWIQFGLLGNTIIPFFLYIFATTHMPFPFTIFAIIAIFSITIPTTIYLFLMMFSFIGFHLFQIINENYITITINILQLLYNFFKTVMFIVTLLLSINFIIKVYS